MTLLERFERSSLDTADIGLNTDHRTPPTVFTPIGARILGWGRNGMDHFCFAPGYGETVFAVCPGRSGFLHAVAGSLAEFLALTYACGGTALLAEAWLISRREFLRRLNAAPRSRKQKCILNALRNSFALPGIADPYTVLLDTHSRTNYASLRFQDDLSEHTNQMPDSRAWPVAFGQRVFHPAESSVKCIPIQKQLTWGAEIWNFPAVYACKEGLVLDILVQIPADRIQRFIQKWEAFAEMNLTPAQQMEIDCENPTDLHTSVSLSLKDRLLPEHSGFREFWNPCGENGQAGRRILEHYGCDREQGWVFLRNYYKWYNKTKAPVHHLKLRLHPLPHSVPGPCFTDLTEGQAVTVIHPVTEKEHILTVTQVSQEGFDYNFLSDIPNCCVALEYSLEPDLPKDEFRLQDIASSDQPHCRHPVQASPDGAAAIGIIGGSDGPTAFFYTPFGKSSGHVAVSSLHYVPAESITWQSVFKICTREPAEMTLVE